MVSFYQVVKEVCNEIKQELTSIKASITIARTFPRVNIDVARIKQLLTNLLQNSIKYRDKTRTLDIEIGYRHSNRETIFFVSDNGSGIGINERSRVFEIFYRGTSEVEGTGIGLSIVKKVIEAHGCKVWIESGKSGYGTDVCFTLPLSGYLKKEKNKKNV
jgi:signal transduction histidine kinase